MSKWLRSLLPRLAAGTLFAASVAAPALADRDFDDHFRDAYRHERGCGHDDHDRYRRGDWNQEWNQGNWNQGYRAPRYAPYRYQRGPVYTPRLGYGCGCGKHWRSRDQFARHLYRYHPNAYYAWFGH